MPVALLHPGVYIEEVPSGVRTITGVATSISAVHRLGAARTDRRALRITSFADYERAYGGLNSRSLLGYAVRQFYDNGGSDAYVLRIADATAVTAACDIGDLHIPASSPGDWATDFSVRLTQRPDDATRFRIDVLQPAANDAVLEILRQPVDDGDGPALRAGRDQRPFGLHRQSRRLLRQRRPATPRLHWTPRRPATTARSSVRPTPHSGRR